MGLRQVRQQGDAILQKKSKTVKEITPAILTLLDDMKETMDIREGVGIAAPQVGMLKRIVVVSYEDEFYEMINPEIIESEGSQVCNEACLSIPDLCGDIERPMKVTVKATDRNGDEYTVTGEGYMASVFCHELDHLDGILYTDKAANIRRLDEEEREERKKRRRKDKEE
ncbi:MAG: peptide deformylase [Firmicutes bacterium]|nr:peptide deformylase [Bacillota bacterium]